MDAGNSIKAAVFSAFLKCPTKAHLMAIGEPAPDAFFADIEARIYSLYKSVAKQSLRVGGEVAEIFDFGQLWRNLDYEAITVYVDCETAVYDYARPPQRPAGSRSQELLRSRTFVPILFCRVSVHLNRVRFFP